ncbi:MAG TPA: M3 family metallopeptidase [Candidatus Deferrimicrobium sp.]|nr:M3 family metallopeptidase [Candidatus Deferrimicrobium sp.]
MKLVRIAWLGLVTVAAFTYSCRRPQATGEEARSLLDSLETKLEWLDYRVNQERWEFYTTGRSDSLDFYQGLYTHVTTDSETFQQLVLAKRQFSTETDERRWSLAYSTLLLSQVEAHPEISRLCDSLSGIDIEFRAEFEGARRTAGYLYQVYRSDPDRQRREEAYRASCAVGLELADGLKTLVALRNRQARKLGYPNYLAMVFSQENLKENEYLSLLHQLDSLSGGRYEAILRKLKTRLGVPNLKPWDLGYAYVDIATQIDRFFPADSQLPFIKRSLKHLGFDLDTLPIYFDLAAREGKSQLAYAFPIKPPYDIRVLANVTDGHYSTQVLMHEIGHALHFAGIAETSPFFINVYSATWTEAMAQTLAGLLDEQEWLTAYANVPPKLVDRYKTARQEQDIMYLRTTLVRLYFEYYAYASPVSDLNELYWGLFEKFMMLSRHEDIKPWAAIIHYTTHPVYLQHYLFADMIAAETADYLAKNYGSVVGNAQIGTFLVDNYFRHGSRYEWRELLERATHQKLNVKYLLEKLQL